MNAPAIDGKFIDVDGVRTWYTDQGAGPVVVLMHGLTLTSDSTYTWFKTVPALAKRYRVIAFDQIGMGRTDLAKDGKFKDRMERIPHAIAFLKAMKLGPACLVGHSEGAFLAARIAIVEPALVSRLVIVTSGATAPNLGDPARDRVWMAANEARYNDPKLYDSVEDYIRISASLNARPHAEAEAILRDNYARAKTRGQHKIFATMPKTDTDYVAREKFQKDYILSHLKNVSIPALLVWAANDPGVIVERGLKLLDYFPKGEMHVFQGSSHNVMWDRAEDFNRLLLAGAERNAASTDKYVCLQ